MAIALGSLARGVLLVEGRILDGVVEVGRPIPILDCRAAPSAFGVVNGDPGVLRAPRVGEASCRTGCIGEPNPVDLEGLAEPVPRLGLGGTPESCFAVIPTYFAAREPGVMFVGTFVLRPGVTSVLVFAAEFRGRAEGVCRLGVFRPVEAAGVTRPLLTDGVTLPLPIDGVTRPLDIEGVFRPLPKEGRAEGVILPDAEKEGVIRPLRLEATDEGREKEIPTVAAESFVDATKTPQLGGHEKYCLLGDKRVSQFIRREWTAERSCGRHC